MTAFSSCRTSIEQACGELPKLETEVARISAELAPYAKARAKGGRSIASVYHPADRTQNEWLKWAEGTLKSAQTLRDSLEDEVKKRATLEPLNEGALILVSFHGFLAQQKYDRAQKSLEGFQNAIIRFRGKLCEQPAPAQAPDQAPRTAPRPVQTSARKS